MSESNSKVSLQGGPSAEGRASFEALYEQWFDHVARWTLALGARSADVDDLTQEVFMVVHRQLDSFDGVSVAGWLYQITRRKVSDHRRLSWVKNVFRGTILPEELGDERPNSFEHLEQRRQSQRLDELLNGLKAEYRAAFVMFELLGYCGEEIAAIQGVAVNTVWSRLHTARKQLKARVKKPEPRREAKKP